MAITGKCPHAIGTDKNDLEKVMFYQFGGQTSGGPITLQSDPDKWKCMFISKLKNVTVQDGDWKTCNNHSRPSTCIVNIDLEVEC